MTNKITKLAIGMATNGLCEARTAFSLATAMMYTPAPMQLFLGIGCYIQQNRNVIVKQAIDAGCSHLLFVDSDMMFDHDAIARLIAHDVDIVGIKANKKIFPVTSLVPEDIKELSEVPFVGTGFMLINLEVFKKIEAPYFHLNEESDSDDLYFCKKAIKAGFKVHCDPTIRIGHIGTHIF